MLGFAVVDVVPDETYTVWLTSRVEPARASHTNAVVFPIDGSDPQVWEQPRHLLADRIVLLTRRTEPSAVAVEEYATEQDVRNLVEATRQLQASILLAFEQYRDRTGKRTLVEPRFTTLPEPPEQGAMQDGVTPAQLTLTVANHLAQVWGAWLTAEQERLKRLEYMPATLVFDEGQLMRELPPEFSVAPTPLRAAR